MTEQSNVKAWADHGQHCPPPTVHVTAVGGLMPAPPGWVAYFQSKPKADDKVGDDAPEGVGDEVGDGDSPIEEDEDEEDARTVVLRVMAFDAHGNALVMDEDAGRLRPVTDFTGFKYVTDVMGEDVHFQSYVAGGGWRVAYGRTREEATERDVVAWAIKPSGEALPIHLDPDGNRDYAWAADAGDPEYAYMKFIPPTAVAHPVAHGRNDGRPAASPNGREATSPMGESVGETVGDTPVAHPSPNGRPKASPTRSPNGRKAASPKASPNGRVKKSPTPTPTADELSDVERARLRVLGEHYPDEVPNRDVVCAYMRAHRIPGFGSKERTDVLIKVLKALRAEYAHLTEQEVPA